VIHKAAMGKKGRKGKRGEQSPGAKSGAATSTAFIALFLLYQVAMPLRYYLGGRGDDERFSWRMFSTVRLQRCQVRVREVAAGQIREVDLSKAVQIAWIGMLERNRPQAVEKLLRRRCQEADVTAVRYLRNCQNTDGSALPELALRLDCARGTIEREGSP
jgi:hypothetical protein